VQTEESVAPAPVCRRADGSATDGIVSAAPAAVPTPTAAGDDRSLVLVVVPTYNERDNLPGIVGRVRAAVPEVELLVVDDSSPDGTGRLADELAAGDGRVHALHRPGKAGLGAAYLAGFEWGLRRGFDVLVEMDADGSHAPEELPRLLAALDEADLALGSRYVPGGRLENWPWHREWLSRWGNRYARLALAVPIQDITGGYRAFRRRTLQQLPLTTTSSRGYCFQVEMAWRAVLAGLVVREVPITFTERRSGTSKMSRAVVGEALWRITCWGAQRRLRRLGRGRPADTAGVTDPVVSVHDQPAVRR
jgi:dolichol-phosphate mannosyltransferase